MLSKIAIGFALFAFVVVCISALVAAGLDSYDPELAWQAVWYAKVASCTNANIVKSWTCGPGCEFHPRFQLMNVHTNSTMGDLAFTGYDPELKAIVVSYQGSEDLQEWLTDADCKQIQYPHGPAGAMIHQGFWNEWSSYGQGVIYDVFMLLQLHPDAKMILQTGHSLGSSVSLLGALEAIRLLRMNSSLPQIPVVIYTFGEPRVGNPAFAEWVATAGIPAPHRQYRVVHKADPVPHLPPMSFLGHSWLQAPQEVWYDNDGNTTYKLCDGTGTHEDPTCSDSILDIDIADHLTYLGVKTACGYSAEEDARKFKMIAKLRKSPKWQSVMRKLIEQKGKN